MRRSIKGQLILLFLLLSLTPIAVTFAIYSPGMLRDLTIQTTQGVRTSSKSQVRLITLWLRERLKEAELLATSPTLLSCLMPGGAATLKSPQEGYGGQPQRSLEESGLGGLYLFDKAGSLKVSKEKITGAILPPLDKEALKKTFEGSPSIHRPPAEEKSNHSLFISVPVLASVNEKRESLGALLVRIDLHQTKSILEDISLTNSRSFLVDGDGNTLAYLTTAPGWGGPKLAPDSGEGTGQADFKTGPLTEGIKACVKDKKEGYSSYAYTNHLEQKVLGAWGWIPELGVGVVVEVDAREVFSPVSAVRGRLWWLLLVVGIGATIVAIFTGRKISEPLISLTSMAQKIAEGNLQERVDVQSPNEIGELAQYINLLAESLSEKNIQLSKVNEKLVSNSLKDGVTGLGNRQGFLRSLDMEYKRAHCCNFPLSLILIELDYSRKINDTHEQPLKNLVLKETAKILGDFAREFDILCRYSNSTTGEEREKFVMILPNTPLEIACSVSEKLRQSIANLVFWQGEISLKPVATIGISTIAEEDVNTGDDLLRHAIEALYEGKRKGGNKVVCWDELSLWRESVHKVEKEATEYYKTKLSSAANSLKRTYMETTMSLLKHLEGKSGFTATNCHLVAIYASHLANDLGLPSEEVEIIKNASILHDIGIVPIPNQILSKPAALTEKEYAVIKTHPEQAARMLDGVGFLQQEIPLIMHHHEWYNGNGYPKGLKGEEIPLGARIIAICDAFEALTSPRPYRPNTSAERAFDVLRQKAGTQFDPNLVEPFIKCMKELLSTSNRLFIPHLNKTVEILIDDTASNK